MLDGYRSSIGSCTLRVSMPGRIISGKERVTPRFAAGLINAFKPYRHGGGQGQADMFDRRVNLQATRRTALVRRGRNNRDFPARRALHRRYPADDRSVGPRLHRRSGKPLRLPTSRPSRQSHSHTGSRWALPTMWMKSPLGSEKAIVTILMCRVNPNGYWLDSPHRPGVAP